MRMQYYNIPWNQLTTNAGKTFEKAKRSRGDGVTKMILKDCVIGNSSILQMIDAAQFPLGHLLWA